MTSEPVDSPLTRRSKLNPTLIGSVLAIAAALATWGMLHVKHRFFKVDSKYDIGMGAPMDARLALLAETARIDRINAAVSLAVGGSLLAVAVACASNSCCALPLRVVVSLLWGALCGAGAGFIGPLVFDKINTGDTLPTATMTGMGQAVVFGCLGLGVGLLYGAFGRSWRTLLQSAIVGASAGALGGIIFPIVASIFLSSHSTGTFISDVSTVRLAWLLVPFLFIGAALPSIGRPDPTKVA